MRILVVEDEHLIANSIKKGLEQERYVVDVSYNGLEGLDLATEGNFDVIVLDIMLPGINGLEICKKLRNNNVHTPILILTARTQISDRVVGLDTGADDYLVKPFAFDELLARVRALSRRPKKVDDQLLVAGDLSLNPRTYEVRRGGRLIKLSGKEFALVDYLIRHKDQVLAKDQLINHVWNYDAEILPNTVEVYIRNLRNKIDKPFKKKIIQTIRGFGYRLAAE